MKTQRQNLPAVSGNICPAGREMASNTVNMPCGSMACFLLSYRTPSSGEYKEVIP